METNRLSKEMQDILISQMTKEAEAAQIYLALGVWAEDQGYSGIANFLYRHAQEERNHMTKIMGYILERGGRPRIQAISAPPTDPQTLTECFNRVFKHEVDNGTKRLGYMELCAMVCQGADRRRKTCAGTDRQIEDCWW